MRSMIPRVVPWTTNQEFQQVFEWLYADMEEHADLVQRGVDHVKAWVCRGRIPISVKSTMDLIELQLRERKQQQQGNAYAGALSQNELRLLYASALTRFVNITEDSLQTTYYAKSMYQIAEEIGLPLRFVQLRHAATHEDLPSLFMLRQASVQALQWLYDSYWDVQKDMDFSTEVNDTKIYAISEAINNYKEKRKATLKSNPVALDSGQKWVKKLIDMLTHDTLKDTVIVSLLKVGVLVPTSKRKRSSLENMTISTELIQLWLPLLQELDSAFPNFATELIMAMVDRIDMGSGYVMDQTLAQVESPPIMESDQQESEKFRQTSYLLTLTCWLRYFATHCGPKNNVFENEVGDDILEACLRKPNLYTRSVLQSIMNIDPTLAKSIRPFILYIDQAINTATESGNPTTTTRTDTNKLNSDRMEEEANELAKELHNLREKLGVAECSVLMDEENSTQSGWRLHDNDTWAACPIGCLPNGKIPNLEFVVNDSVMNLD